MHGIVSIIAPIIAAENPIIGEAFSTNAEQTAYSQIR